MATAGPQPAAKAGALAPAELSRDSRSSSYDHADLSAWQEGIPVAPVFVAHPLHPHQPQQAYTGDHLLYCAEPLASSAVAPPAAAAVAAPAAAPAAAAVPPPAPLSLHNNGVALEDILAMIRHQRDREAELAPSPTHLEDSHGRAASGDEFVTPQMRLIVASWVVEVAEEFGLQQETLHLAVALLDRFLSATRGVPRGVLQLAAVAAVLVASKEQEVAHPSVGRLTAISANCFRAEDLLRMERILLDALEFRVSSPTAFTFLHLYVQALAMMGAVAPPPPAAAAMAASSAEGAIAPGGQYDGAGAGGGGALLSTAATYTAAYLVELAMLDYAMLAYPPSVLAAAAIVVGGLTAQQAQQAGEQPCLAAAAASPSPQMLAARLALVSGFSPAALQSCASALLRLHRAAARPESAAAAELLLPVRGKFGSDAWCCAAHAPPLAALPAPLFR